MSGFPADWLRLREPFDHAARDPASVAALERSLPPGPVSLVDLGCGLGSNLRYVARRLHRPQRWTLVDHDERLLDTIPAELDAWTRRTGGSFRQVGDHFSLDGRIDVFLHRLDLDGADPWPEARVVTTQALLDLVSERWLERLVRFVVDGDRPLLAALTVDGRVHWSPADDDDAEVQAAFRAHQLTDRGFGASPGPRAAAWLAGRLAAEGRRVVLAEADWAIGPADRQMLAEMVAGTAHAAAETHARPERVRAWEARRRDGIGRGLALRVGHLDLWGPAQASGVDQEPL